MTHKNGRFFFHMNQQIRTYLAERRRCSPGVEVVVGTETVDTLSAGIPGGPSGRAVGVVVFRS